MNLELAAQLTWRCITQLKAQGPSRTCNESKEEEKLTWRGHGRCLPSLCSFRGTLLIRNTHPPRITIGP